MAYGQLIKDAFHVALRNRYLWFFGLFAGVPSFNFSVQVPTGSDDSPGSSGSGAGFPELDAGVLVALGLALLALIALFVALSAVSQGALADSVAAAQSGERRGFRAAWRAGRSTFWRVLGVFVLGFLIGLGLLLAVGLPLAGLVLAAFTLTDAIVVKVLAVVAAVLLGLAALVLIFIPFTVVLQYAVRELVLRGTAVVESLRAGWRLFRRNPLPSFLLLLIQQGIAFGAGFLTFLAILILTVPAFVLLVAGTGGVGIATAGVTALVVIPLGLAALGAIGTFSHAFWTLAYLRLEPRGVG